MAEKYYTLVEAGKILGIKVRTARQWVHDGKLKAIKYPGTQRWFVSSLEIERMLHNDNED